MREKRSERALAGSCCGAATPAGARCDTAAPASCCGGSGAEDVPWVRLGIALVLAGQTMMLSLGLNTGGDRPAYGSDVYWLVHGGLMLAALVVMGLLGPRLLREQLRALRARRITVEALFVLSLAGAFTGSLVSTLSGTGSVYYEIVAVVLSVYTLGKAIGARSRARALSEARRLRDDFSQAWLLDEAGGRSRVPVAELCRTRSRVSVLPGEAVSVDGVVLSGEGLVQETPLTGEPLPVVRRPGDRLLAGSHSVDGAFVLRPERLAGERRLDAVLAAVEQGGVERPSTLQRQADRLMQWFVPAVVLTAAATFVVWLAVLPTGLWWQALFNAMAVLLVACPCALGLATPTAIWGGLVRFSTFGLVAQGGRLLDTLAEANLILFDKTGTLSHDSLALVDFITTEDSPEERRRLLAALAAMEDGLPHPIARAFAQAAGGNGALPPVERRTLVPGQGLRAWVDGREIAVGEASLTGLPETAFAPLLARSRAVEGGCKKRVHVAVDGRPAALAVLDEHLRDNAAATFRELTALGLRLLVLTGDPDPRWREIEGVEVRPGLSPDDKARIVRELRARGEALTFVGDGINDAPAMTAAGSAIAMGSGAALALSSADGILSDGNLAALPRAIRIARRVRAGIRGNMLFAVCYNAIGMALAAAGILHPAVAALLMVGSSTFVSARALATAREEQGAN